MAKSQTSASCGPLHFEVFSLTLTYFDFDWPSPKPDFDRQCHPHFPKVREAWGFNILKWKKTHPAPWCWESIAFLLSKGVWTCVWECCRIWILEGTCTNTEIAWTCFCMGTMNWMNFQLVLAFVVVWTGKFCKADEIKHWENVSGIVSGIKEVSSSFANGALLGDQWGPFRCLQTVQNWDFFARHCDTWNFQCKFCFWT